MKKSLYNIEAEYCQLIAEIEERDGELTPELEEQLMINEMQLQSKSIAYLEVIGGAESYITRIDDEIKRLQALKKRSGNIVTKLRGSLLDAVKLFGEFEVGLTKFGTRKSSYVEVYDVDSLPAEFKTVKVTEAANKVEIAKALKRGVEIKGCSIKENINLKIN